MAKIKNITAREIFDSRGNPTIETTVFLDDDTIASASCPSGSSVGAYEAIEIRDHDLKRFDGLGILKAVENVEKLISPKLIGKEANDQPDIDKSMIEYDGTENKSMLGANSMLSVSMAVSRAAANSQKIPLFEYLRQFINIGESQSVDKSSLKIPTPIFNIINGGKHAGMNLDFQEFIIIPAGSKQYSYALKMGIDIYRALSIKLKEQGMTTLVGDEGGFGPIFFTNMDALSVIVDAVGQTSYRVGYDVFLGLDAASNSFLLQKQYVLRDRQIPYGVDEIIDYYVGVNKKFHLMYLEDALSEDDWDGWTKLNGLIGNETIIVGDDLTATNPYRLQTAIIKKAITGIIIKPNQIGTIMESLVVVEIAKNAGLKTIVSHRSGETNDDFMADFAVAIQSDYVKFGAPVRGERVAKYNRLLEIEKQIIGLSQSTK